MTGVTFMEISSSWLTSDISFLVHLLNLLLIVQLSLEPNQLHGVGQDVLVQKTLRLEVYVLGDLEAVQSLFPTRGVQLLQHTGSEVSVPDDLLVWAIEAVFLGELQQVVLERRRYQDSVVLRRLSVKENLAWIQQLVRIFRVSVLNLLRCDVFPLLQLENILLTVDDLEGIGMGHYLNDIPRLEPSIRSNGLSSLIRLLVIAKKNMRTSHPQLPSRR
jgi:hypothetical protein